MKKFNSKNGSAAKKLIPAVGMLGISAVMLGTSTFAWFTMSKEVNVENIQLTATSPTNVQMSLGLGMGGTALNAIGTDDGVGLVKAPKNDDESLDWDNVVSFYDYYAAPKLLPASSTTGGSIFYIPDNEITHQGKTIKAGGTAKTASTGGTLTVLSSKATTIDPNSEPEGRYIDFPVWFRTSSTSDITLSVAATAIVGTNDAANNANNKLYKAARVAILNTTDGSAWTSSSNVVLPSDNGRDQTLANKYYAKSDGDPLALKAAASYTSTGETNRGGDAYGAVSGYDGSSAVVTIKAKGAKTDLKYAGNCTPTTAGTTDNIYGAATCAMVRVWLEGEDVDCWNATAGQDFKINLKFTTIESGSGS